MGTTAVFHRQLFLRSWENFLHFSDDYLTPPVKIENYSIRLQLLYRGLFNKTPCFRRVDEEEVAGSVVFQGRVEVGAPGFVGFKIAVVDENYHELSPWHHVPLYTPECDSILYHFVCTTPAGTTLQFRPDPSQQYFPLTVLSKDGSAAHFDTPFPWNLGFLPQTCRNSSTEAGTIELSSVSRQPINVLEVSGGPERKTGEIYAVKVLGAIRCSDKSEQPDRDFWTLISIAADHRMADELTDVADLETKMPGMLATARQWVQSTHRGNHFSSCEMVDSPTASFQVVDAHGGWKDVCSNEADALSDDPNRDRRLRSRRRGNWSVDPYQPTGRRRNNVMKDVMFRPSTACLLRELGEGEGEQKGGGTKEAVQVTKIGTKVDLRSPREVGKEAGAVGGDQKRGRRMSLGSVRVWGEDERAVELENVREVMEVEGVGKAVPGELVQTMSEESRISFFSRLFLKWKGPRCQESVAPESKERIQKCTRS